METIIGMLSEASGLEHYAEMRKAWYEKGREDERMAHYDKAQHVATDLANRQLLISLKETEKELEIRTNEVQFAWRLIREAVDILNSNIAPITRALSILDAHYDD